VTAVTRLARRPSGRLWLGARRTRPGGASYNPDVPERLPEVTPQLVREDLTEEQLQAFLRAPQVAVDTETLGLHPLRDRLCVVQVCDRAGRVVLVQVPREQLTRPGPAADRAPRLKRLLEEPAVLKVLHFARFDLAALKHNLGIDVAPIYCTRTASKLIRTYTERHGLRDLALELLDIEMDKSVRHTDWASLDLTPEQVRYAAADVTLLLTLMDRLNVMLEREERRALADECFRVIATLVRLDLLGYEDLFIH
jgi:ribonuclease D